MKPPKRKFNATTTERKVNERVKGKREHAGP